MRTYIQLFILSLCLVRGFTYGEDAAMRFRYVDLWVDSGESTLAAYQVEITYPRGQVRIVGLEGVDAGAFNPAPFYDRAGLEGGRIVVAAFTTDHENAPRGRTCVARLHLAVSGPGKPELDMAVKLMTAAAAGGKRISINVRLQPQAQGAPREP